MNSYIKSTVCFVLCVAFSLFTYTDSFAFEQYMLPKLDKALVLCVRDFLPYDGNTHRLHLGMSRDEVMKIMDARGTKKELDERWAEKHERQVVRQMRDFHFSEESIARVVEKNHDKSTLVYRYGIIFNPVVGVPLNYRFEFQNDKLIDYSLTFRYFRSVENDNANYILTKVYQEIYGSLGAPNADPYMIVGIVGRWLSEDKKRMIELKAAFTDHDRDIERIKEDAKADKDIRMYLCHGFCDIKIRSFFYSEM